MIVNSNKKKRKAILLTGFGQAGKDTVADTMIQMTHEDNNFEPLYKIQGAFPIYQHIKRISKGDPDEMRKNDMVKFRELMNTLSENMRYESPRKFYSGLVKSGCVDLLPDYMNEITEDIFLAKHREMGTINMDGPTIVSNFGVWVVCQAEALKSGNAIITDVRFIPEAQVYNVQLDCTITHVMRIGVKPTGSDFQISKVLKIFNDRLVYWNVDKKRMLIDVESILHYSLDERVKEYMAKIDTMWQNGSFLYDSYSNTPVCLQNPIHMTMYDYQGVEVDEFNEPELRKKFKLDLIRNISAVSDWRFGRDERLFGKAYNVDNTKSLKTEWIEVV